MHNELTGMVTGAVIQARDIAGGVHVHHSVRPVSRPSELLSDVPGFTGRAKELVQLDTLLAAGSAARIVLMSGTAGVGKTALAMHWAHRVREHFPDGDLYVDLQGYGPLQPIEPSVVLAGFLRALGADGVAIPADQAERATRYRSLIAGRRVLVVLDNARTVEQVRPLLPGDSSCFVVVTSRDSLAGLVARHGAHRVVLDLLPPDEALGLLHTLIGTRAVLDPDATAALAEHCARLPLALRVVAERAIARPSARLADLVADLADERRRLDLLDSSGDEHTAVRTVLSWSYRNLSSEAARAFRRFSSHPGPDFDARAAAALVGTGLIVAQQLTETLVRAHLVEEGPAGRYRMHDLLRTYAAELAAHIDSESERQAALDELFDFYLHAAAAAMEVIAPHRPQIQALFASDTAKPDYDHAMTWLDAERPVLVNTAAHALAHGRPAYAYHLSQILFHYLDVRAQYDDALALQAHGLTAARQMGDRPAQDRALAGLGDVHMFLGHYDELFDLCRQALMIACETGDRVTHGQALVGLAVACWYRGRYDQALDRCHQALSLARETNDLLTRRHALIGLGFVCARFGRNEEAAEYFREALEIARSSHDPGIHGYALVGLGLVHSALGNQHEALTWCHQALRLAGETGDRVTRRHALNELGSIHHQAGHHREAVHHYRQALALAREAGDRGFETAVLNGLGDTAQAIEALPEAAEWYREALQNAKQTGDRFQQGRAHGGLSQLCDRRGDVSGARQHAQHARSLYADLGLPESDDITALLDAVRPWQKRNPPPRKLAAAVAGSTDDRKRDAVEHSVLPTITGTAAGVPFTALPPTTMAEGAAPLVVTWHMMDAPCTNAAFAAALPMTDVPAWRVHLGLPLSGERLRDGTMDAVIKLVYEDVVLAYMAPVVRQAVEEFPAALAELRERLPVGDGPIGIVGGSLGGAIALEVMARASVPVAAAALINPAVRAQSVVELVETASGQPYPWTAQRRTAANRLDFVARAGEIACRVPQPPLLIASGALDHPMLRRDATELVDSLREQYRQPDHVRLTTVPDLAHPLAEPPGVQPAPQLPVARAVDRAITQWFRDHLG